MTFHSSKDPLESAQLKIVLRHIQSLVKVAHPLSIPVLSLKPGHHITSLKTVWELTIRYIQDSSDSELLSQCFVKELYCIESTMTSRVLYSVSDSPPSCAVRLALEAMELPYSVIEIDYANGEHLLDEYAKKNPQREVPCLDDNGFILSESTAILQYLADKYDTTRKLYPKDLQQRAIVNHRLAFNISTYYQRILDYAVLPIFFDYKQTETGLNKMKAGLSAFNTIIQREGKKCAAADDVTIADFALIAATMCLEAVDYEINTYPFITQWYSAFKKQYPKLWSTAEKPMLELRAFSKNPPNLSAMRHPFHPIRQH